MQVIQNSKPSPRLLSSAAVEVQSGENRPAKASRHKLKRSGELGGNGKAVFKGLLIGALIVAAAGYFVRPGDSVEDHLASLRKFVAVRTRAVSLATPRADKPAGLRVQIDPSMLRVTAIALGHPRLAIINGKEVTEGDALTIENPDGSVSVTLRIVNIAEGRIELTDGTQIVTAPLATKSGSGSSR